MGLRSTLAPRRLTCLILVTLSALWGCEEEEQGTDLKPDPGQVSYPDFEIYADAGPDADLPDADLPDAAPWSASAHPTFEEVAILQAGDPAYVFWYDGADLRVRRLGSGGVWEGPSEVITALESPPAGMATVELRGQPWLIFAGDEGRVHVWNARRDDPPTPIDLQGAPLVANLGGDMLIVGGALPPAVDPEADAGVGVVATGLAWVKVSSAGAVGEAVPDTLSLPRPDGVTGLNGDAMLRFSDVGQCVQIDGATLAPLGNLGCQIGRGRLAADGGRYTVTHLQERAEGLVYAIRPLFGPGRESPFFLGLSAAAELTRFPLIQDGWPMVLRVLRPDPEEGEPINGRLELVVAGPGGLLRSERVWDAWPYDGVRGFLTEIDITTTPDGQGGFITERSGTAYGVRFGGDDDPDLVTIPMDVVEFPSEPFGFVNLDTCLNPQAEICDGEDNDCDGRIDNGLCCLDEDEHVDYWILNLSGPLTEIILGDVINYDAFDAALRIGESFWEGRQLYTRFSGGSRPLNGFRDLGSDLNNFATFHDMYAWGPSGGCRIMVGQQDPDGPLVARWTRSDDVSGDPRPIQDPVVLDNCSEILAADPTQPVDNQPESAVIVCPESMWRLYCRPDDELVALDPRLLIPPNQYDFADLIDDLPEGGAVSWGTITRSEDIIRDIFVGYRNTEGQWRLRSFQFNRQGAQEITSLPAPIQALNDEGGPLPWPIYLYGVASGSQVEVETGVATEDTRIPRVWYRGVGQYQWADVAPAPSPGDRVEFMAHPRYKRLLYSRPVEEAPGVMDFWALNLTENFGVNPWATAPAFTFRPGDETGQGEDPIIVDEAHPILWATHKGRYEPSVVLAGYLRDRVQDGEKIGEVWRFMYKRLSCTSQ